MAFDTILLLDRLVIYLPSALPSKVSEARSVASHGSVDLDLLHLKVCQIPSMFEVCFFP